MSKRRIFAVGLSLPGDQFEQIAFDSDRTLSDADIIVFQPTLGDCHNEYARGENTLCDGKPVLTEESSYTTYQHVLHWRREIIEAVKAGKLVVVYLVKPDERVRYTGETTHSDTGKSRVAKRAVAAISSYHAVPNVRSATLKTGSEVVLREEGAFLSPYWRATAEFSAHEVELEGDFSSVVLATRPGTRIVGAAKKANGMLLLLPPLHLDQKRFIRWVDDDQSDWSTDAQQFGKKLASLLAGIADDLKNVDAKSPPPVSADVRSDIGPGMLDHLKAKNRAWAERKTSADPGFFKRLELQQAPQYLWIGCSDSRVPANEIVDLDPGELFVHRNVANLAPPQDANYLSVLQFAVDVLKVKHIMVVGHYGCGGIAAAVDGKRRGLVDHWLHPIRELAEENRAELDKIADERARLDRLCELNIIRQVKNVASDVFVQDARARGQDLWIHGWIYSIADGLIRDLDVTVGPC